MASLLAATCYSGQPVRPGAPYQVQRSFWAPVAGMGSISCADGPADGYSWDGVDRDDLTNFGQWTYSVRTEHAVLDLEDQPWLVGDRWGIARAMIRCAKDNNPRVKWGLWVDPWRAPWASAQLVREPAAGGGFNPGMLDEDDPAMVAAVMEADFACQCIYAFADDAESTDHPWRLPLYRTRVAASILRWRLRGLPVIPAIAAQFHPQRSPLDCNEYVGDTLMDVQCKAVVNCGSGMFWGGNRFRADGSVDGCLPWSQFGEPARRLFDAANAQRPART